MVCPFSGKGHCKLVQSYTTSFDYNMHKSNILHLFPKQLAFILNLGAAVNKCAAYLGKLLGVSLMKLDEAG